MSYKLVIYENFFHLNIARILGSRKATASSAVYYFFCTLLTLPLSEPKGISCGVLEVFIAAIFIQR